MCAVQEIRKISIFNLVCHVVRSPMIGSDARVAKTTVCCVISFVEIGLLSGKFVTLHTGLIAIDFLEIRNFGDLWAK